MARNDSDAMRARAAALRAEADKLASDAKSARARELQAQAEALRPRVVDARRALATLEQELAAVIQWLDAHNAGPSLVELNEYSRRLG